MENVQIEYTERNVDLNMIKEIATASARSIQEDYDEWEREAIKNHDEYYIRNELRKISTFELIKELLKRCYK